MNLYLIYQDLDHSYDMYLSAVVCARDENSAKFIHPNGTLLDANYKNDYLLGSWVNIKDVEIKYLGKADKNIKENSVICSEFKAG